MKSSEKCKVVILHTKQIYVILCDKSVSTTIYKFPINLFLETVFFSEQKISKISSDTPTLSHFYEQSSIGKKGGKLFDK